MEWDGASHCRACCACCGTLRCLQLTEAESRLEGLLAKAEGLLGSLQQSVAIPAPNPQEAAAAEDGRRYLFSLAGLRK